MEGFVDVLARGLPGLPVLVAAWATWAVRLGRRKRKPWAFCFSVPVRKRSVTVPFRIPEPVPADWAAALHVTVEPHQRLIFLPAGRPYDERACCYGDLRLIRGQKHTDLVIVERISANGLIWLCATTLTLWLAGLPSIAAAFAALYGAFVGYNFVSELKLLDETADLLSAELIDGSSDAGLRRLMRRSAAQAVPEPTE